MARAKQYEMSKVAQGHSIDWIRRQYNTAIKAANDRIKTLQKTQYRDHANAYKFLVRDDLTGAPFTKQRGGATVFKALPKKTGNALTDRAMAMEGLRAVERFLGAKTSTVRGIKEVVTERRAELQRVLSEEWAERGGKGSAPKLTDTEADNILYWLGSEEGKEAKKQFDSNQVRDAVNLAVVAERKDGQSKTISELYNEFMSSGKSMGDWIRESENRLGFVEL